MSGELNSLENAKKALIESKIHLRFIYFVTNFQSNKCIQNPPIAVSVLHPNNKTAQQQAGECLSVIEELPRIFEKIPNDHPTKKAFMDGVEAEMIAKAENVVKSAKSNHK